MNLRSKIAKLAVILTMAAGLLAVGTSSASANSLSTGGTTTSTISWNTGSTMYTQNHGGDDLAFDVTSGNAIDMRWITCNGSQTGTIKYNITAGESFRIIGMNFLATTCLKLQFRGYTQTGAFTGITYWNYNFA
ncbi:MAG: hypothetical protein ABI047_12310 [Jatrophihabitantaceae bacterium]